MQACKNLTAALLCLSTLGLAAQQIDDPANLMGERVSAPALADTLPIDHGAPALEQLLRKLRTRASMMLIVAHPDDEDGGLLTLESRGMGARVAMLTLTRGEGGQNLMTGDFNDALGLIRTQELLAEDRYTGTAQFFGTEVDFGFSKTKEEAFKQWTHERVLYDAVRAVRLYRPLVLASVFIGGVTDGHGQHQVSGEITQEVFLAAADPKVFPEMGLPPWAPLRVYARVPFAPITDKGMFDYATGTYLPPHFHNYVTGVDTTTPPRATVTIHEGEVPNIPAFEGKSYVQWARQGLALQKTQIGPNVRIPPAGRVDVGYTLYGTRPTSQAIASQEVSEHSASLASAEPLGNPTPPGTRSLQTRVSYGRPKTRASALGANADSDQDLFTGIDTTLPSIADLAPHAPASLRTTLIAIDTKTAEAQHLFNPDHPELTAPPLRDALKQLDTLITQTESSNLPAEEKFNILHELRTKRIQFNDSLVLALGLSLEVTSPESTALTSQSKVIVSWKLANSGTEKVTVSGLSFPTTPTTQTLFESSDRSVMSGSSIEGVNKFELDGNEPATRPYFSRPDLEQPYYSVSRPDLRNAAMTPAPLIATARVWSGVELTLRAVVRASTGAEFPPQAVLITPPVSLAVRPGAGIIPTNRDSSRIETVLNPFRLNSTLPSLKLPEGWNSKLLPIDPLPPAGSILTEEWQISAVAIHAGTTYPIQAVVRDHGREYIEGYRPVGYPGLTYTNYYTPATYKVTAVDVTTAPHLHIAYLPGTGDEVPEFLPSLGVTPTMLSAKDLTAENLKQYDAIILGVRAYSAHPELEGAGSNPLNDYAKQGGVVIAQYNSGGFNPASAPYPYTLPGDSAHNVVDEDQPVQLLAPTNPLLTWPNRITSADFSHWIEERGHGFASDWAPEYTPLLETHDPGQDPQKGGLLLAKVGKGAYIYCAFALYRQLPEGVPGAYRLLANLVSYAKNPTR